MLYLIDNQIVISIIINIHYPELRLVYVFQSLLSSILRCCGDCANDVMLMNKT
jgi:hypothetical protein